VRSAQRMLCVPCRPTCSSRACAGGTTTHAAARMPPLRARPMCGERRTRRRKGTRAGRGSRSFETKWRRSACSSTACRPTPSCARPQLRRPFLRVRPRRWPGTTARGASVHTSRCPLC
jgi:hypothetical protein